MKLLLFDIDGTLLHAGHAPKHAVNLAFEELFGVTDAFGETVTNGRTDPLILHDIAVRTLDRDLSADEYHAVCKLYCTYLPEALRSVPGFHVLPGVRELLEECSAHPQILLGLETGNIEGGARLKLDHGKISHYFAFGGFGSDSSERADIIRAAIERARNALNVTDLEAQNIFVFGDAPQDVTAANLLGLNSIAVTTGRFCKEDLSTYGPMLILEDLRDRKRILDFVVGD